MRLINTQTLDVEEFFGSDIPKYAILSHTWESGQEVSFQEWQSRGTTTSHIQNKSGYAKITTFCGLALTHGLHWAWVDTNCIDKTSSAELSEAINSMFAWYRRSKVCYVILSDVPSAAVSSTDNTTDLASCEALRRSRWFTRGWTLQELLAPAAIRFYSSDWNFIGDKFSRDLMMVIAEITGIQRSVLEQDDLYKMSIATRMSWLAKRQTTREEDLAYCMLGIFGLNMPLLYGEGMGAFLRLQEALLQTTNDKTIFCWSWHPDIPISWPSVLAPFPRAFEYSGSFKSRSTYLARTTQTLTNIGLMVELKTIPAPSGIYVELPDVYLRSSYGPSEQIYIWLQRNGPTYQRSPKVKAPFIGSWLQQLRHYKAHLPTERRQLCLQVRVPVIDITRMMWPGMSAPNHKKSGLRIISPIMIHDPGHRVRMAAIQEIRIASKSESKVFTKNQIDWLKLGWDCDPAIDFVTWTPEQPWSCTYGIVLGVLHRGLPIPVKLIKYVRILILIKSDQKGVSCHASVAELSDALDRQEMLEGLPDISGCLDSVVAERVTIGWGPFEQLAPGLILRLLHIIVNYRTISPELYRRVNHGPKNILWKWDQRDGSASRTTSLV